MVKIIFPPGIPGAGSVTISGDPPIYAVEIAPNEWEISYQDLQVLATFTNDVNTALEGATIDDVNFVWTYNRNGDDPTSQSIDNGIGAIANNLRAFGAVGLGLVADTTFELSAVGDDGNPSSLTTSIDFRPAYYFGVDAAILDTGAEIEGSAAIYASEALGTARQRTLTYDASGGGGVNYLYYAYPEIWGLPASTTFNGFEFNDYTVYQNNPDTDIENSAGFTRNYIILRTNNTYGGSDIEWRIF